MFLPIRTDYRMTLRPWVNYALIAMNVALYVGGFNGAQHHIANAEAYLLHPDTPQIYQFFTSMFMHGSWMHLLGNMVFLWVFGNALNDRFGHAGYLAFYLAGGLLAGVGYLAMSASAPVLGASGAISAVTGAYLVLLPRTRVTVLVFLFFIIPLEISSLYFIGFQFIWNLVMSFNDTITSMPGAGAGGVAYWAHSSGYVFGIAVAVLLLVLKVVPTDKMDLVNMVQMARRRGEYQRAVAQGFDPFGSGNSGPGGSRWVATKTVETTSPDTPAAQELQLRREISQHLSDHDMRGAIARYLELVHVAPEAVLSLQHQLDIANQLMAGEEHAAAADAYERFLKHYPTYEYAPDIYLMLGLLYGRYLHTDDRAELYLRRAIETLKDPRKQELARTDLAALRRG